MKQQIAYTHLFGEMDLYMNQSSDEMYKHAMRISEDCGYMPEWNKETNCLELYGSDSYEMAKVFFDKNDKVCKVERSSDQGKNWETLNFKENLFEVSQETLKKYFDEITMYEITPKLSLPMSQGLLLQELIKRYAIPIKKVGYHFDHIACETNKQVMLWRDNGVGAEFMGIINKNEI